MFIISCKYDGEEHPNHDPSKAIPIKSPIRECVKSIVELHPNEKVVVVDSDSGDKSYFQDIQKYDNVIILDCKNKIEYVVLFMKHIRIFLMRIHMFWFMTR